MAGSGPIAGRAPLPGPRRVTLPAAPKGPPLGLWIGLATAAVVLAGYFAMQPKTPPPAKPIIVAVPKAIPKPVAKPVPSRLVVVEEKSLPATPPPAAQGPATPTPKLLSATGQWLAEQEWQWKEAFRREVTIPYEKDEGDLKSQCVTALEALHDAATRSGQLEAAVVLRDEQQRFAKGGETLATNDLPATLPALQALRTNYRKSLAALESTREVRAKNVAARYDAIMANNLLLLTRSQRLDEALELKTKREQLAAEWLKPSANSLALAASVARGTPAATPDPSFFSTLKGSLSTKPPEKKND